MERRSWRTISVPAYDWRLLATAEEKAVYMRDRLLAHQRGDFWQRAARP